MFSWELTLFFNRWSRSKICKFIDRRETGCNSLRNHISAYKLLYYTKVIGIPSHGIKTNIYDIVTCEVWYISSQVKILMASLISCFTLKLYICWCMIKTFSDLPQKSLVIFWNFQKCSETITWHWTTLGESSESGAVKSLENYQKCCYQYVYIINKNNTWLLVDVEYLFFWTLDEMYLICKN